MQDPAPSPATAFAEHCRRGELAYQMAPDGTAVFPPRLAQPGTGAPLRWAVSSGRGVVHATTVVRRRGEPPENVVLVDLDEGFRMMSRVDGLAPQDVRIGLRVAVRFEDEVPVFAADEAEPAARAERAARAEPAARAGPAARAEPAAAEPAARAEPAA